MDLHQCPCCDYFTLEEPPQKSDVCPVCFWEDDGEYLDRPDLESSQNNGLTLREARENFRNVGACEVEMVEHVLPESERGKYRREVRQIE